MNRWLFYSIFISLSARAMTPEDWNFTPADFSALTQSGIHLRFESDSDWLPQQLQSNLLSTLNVVLAPSAGPRSTDGVNINDLYHAHVACTAPELTGKIDYDQASRSVRVLSEHHLNRLFVREENLPELIQAIRELEIEGSAVLNSLIGSKYCDLEMIYHTYERVSPTDGSTIEANDPRRNLVTLQSDFVPKRQVSTDQGAFQIAFLIDKKGVVHATIGSFLELSKVTGKLETPL